MCQEFRCNNNKCVHKKNVCNLINDCEDGSDEDQKMCKVCFFLFPKKI